MVVSIFGVASSIRGLAFDPHRMLMSLVQVVLSFACLVHVFAMPFVGRGRRGILN